MKPTRKVRQVFILLFPLVLTLVVGCRTSPADRSARFIHAGKQLLKKNDVSRAILEFRNGIQATPGDPEAHYQLGLAYIQGGDAARAASSFRRTLELKANHADAQLKLAQLLAGSSDPALWKDAQQRLEAILGESPGNAMALHALALTELRLGSAQDAMQHLERALSLAPQEFVVAITLAHAKLERGDVKGTEQTLREFASRQPNSAEAAIVLARFYEAHKRVPQAEEQYHRAALLNPKSAEAVFGLATLQLRQGRKEEAEKNLKKLSDFPYTPVRTIYGVYLFGEGRHDEAIRELERVQKLDPEDRTARTRLVAAYASKNRIEDAERLLSAALKANEKDVDALLQRGELFLTAGKLPEAEVDLNQVLRVRPDAAEAHYAVARLYRARGTLMHYRQELNEALRLNPALLSVRLELAKAHLAENATSAAIAALDGAPEEQKRSLPYIEQRNWAFLASSDSAQARAGIDQGLAIARTPDLLLQDAILKIRARQYAEARQTLQQALDKAPGDIRLLRAIVGSYSAQNQTVKAVAEVRAHAAKNPQSPEVQFFLGNLLFETGAKTEAVRAFTSVKAISPNYVPADIELARVNLQQANWTDARQQLTGILSGQENAQARLWMGMLEASVGNKPAALEHFRKVLILEPDNAVALNNTAFLLVEQGDRSEEPLKFARRAKELQPDNAEFDDTLGWVLYHRGLYDMAAKQLELAVARRPTAVRHYHLAMACYKAGLKDRSRKAFEAGLRIDPNLPEANSARQVLDADR